jgi:GST-like protein
VDKPFIVYGAKGSGSIPVEAALTLAGAPFEVVEAPTWESEEQRARVAVVNPMRQVPALVLPSGEVLTESAAILMWIAEQFPEARLAPPPGDPMRAAYLRWMVYVPAAIYSLYWIRDDPSRVVEGEAARDLILERTRERIAECWRIMDQQITPGRYLLGDELSVLDLYVAVASRWGPRRARFHQDAPKMSPVVRRVDSDPRLVDFWNRRFPFEGVYAA